MKTPVAAVLLQGMNLNGRRHRRGCSHDRSLFIKFAVPGVIDTQAPGTDGRHQLPSAVRTDSSS